MLTLFMALEAVPHGPTMLALVLFKQSGLLQLQGFILAADHT